MTLTQTRAVLRSGAVSTSVTVTNPIRGSWTSAPGSRRSPGAAARRSGRFGRSSVERFWPNESAGSQRQATADRLTVWVVKHSMTSPFDDVSRVGEADAALEARLDLADVVLEPAQRVDLVGRDDLAAAPQAGAAVADDPAVGDVRAGDDRIGRP